MKDKLQRDVEFEARNKNMKEVIEQKTSLMKNSMDFSENIKSKLEMNADKIKKELKRTKERKKETKKKYKEDLKEINRISNLINSSISKWSYWTVYLIVGFATISFIGSFFYSYKEKDLITFLTISGLFLAILALCNSLYDNKEAKLKSEIKSFHSKLKELKYNMVEVLAIFTLYSNTIDIYIEKQFFIMKEHEFNKRNNNPDLTWEYPFKLRYHNLRIDLLSELSNIQSEIKRLIFIAEKYYKVNCPLLNLLYEDVNQFYSKCYQNIKEKTDAINEECFDEFTDSIWYRFNPELLDAIEQFDYEYFFLKQV